MVLQGTIVNKERYTIFDKANDPNIIFSSSASLRILHDLKPFTF